MSNSMTFFVQRYFLSFLIKQHNYGQNTISSYRDTFRLLIDYLSKTGHTITEMLISDLDADSISGYLQWLKDTRNSSPATRNVRLAHMKSFFRYTLAIAPEYSDQCRKVLAIPFAKSVKKPPECLSVEEVKQLLQSINVTNDAGLRDLAIISLLYDSGCRVQELIDLNVTDFQDGKCSRIYVHGKGNKYRSIPILPQTAKIISKYIKHYGISGNISLFFNARGERFTRQGIRYILQKRMSMATSEAKTIVDTKIFPHKLRHSKASHLVAQGVNIYNVRDFLGHESVVTTQVYLTSNPEVTRKVIEHASQRTIPDGLDYYSDEVKNDLMTFLNSLR